MSLFRLDLAPDVEGPHVKHEPGDNLSRLLIAARAERNYLLAKLGRPVPEEELCGWCPNALPPRREGQHRRYCSTICKAKARNAARRETSVRIEPGVYG